MINISRALVGRREASLATKLPARFLILLVFTVGGASFAAREECATSLSGETSKIEYNGASFQLTRLTELKPIVLMRRPRLAAGFEPESPIARDLDTVWDLNKFKTARGPMVLEPIKDPPSFSMPSDLRILDMPIKMSGSNEYRVPSELRQFSSVIQQIIDHEHAMLTDETIKKYFAYITIDQGWVEADTSQRNPGNHVDGFQGARIKEKTEINHSYLVMDQTPTVFYPQPFNFDGLDDSVHDYFKEMDRLGDDEKSIEAPLNKIVLIDAYTVHRAVKSTRRVYRTFFRLSYDVKEFDRLGNTKNPHFDYDWDMVARDAHAQLTEYKPIEQCRACGMCPRGRALQTK